MNLLFLSVVLAWSFLQGEFHQMSIGRLDGGQVRLSSFSGQKVLITVFDPSTPDMGHLRLLDSLQMAGVGKLAVIAVPGVDLGQKPVRGHRLKEVLAPLDLKLTVAEPLQVKKTSGGQHAVLRWLTHAEGNIHFNVDVKEAGQVFVVSGKGQLYAVLGSKTPRSLLNRVLQQEVKE